MSPALYGEDLSFVHHHGFGDFAEAAAPGLLHLLRDAAPAGGLVVDLGCGSGIWARAALAAGYDVLGVDASPAMLALARANAPGAGFEVGSLHAVPLPPCVAITAIGESISYLPPDLDHVDPAPFFERAWDALAPAGVLIFDVVERGDPLMCYRSRRTGSGWEVDVDVSEDPLRGIITRRIRTTREADSGRRHSDEIHRVQTFARVELERRLRVVGFEVRLVTGYGDASLPPRRIGFVANKPFTL